MPIKRNLTDLSQFIYKLSLKAERMKSTTFETEMMKTFGVTSPPTLKYYRQNFIKLGLIRTDGTYIYFSNDVLTDAEKELTEAKK